MHRTPEVSSAPIATAVRFAAALVLCAIIGSALRAFAYEESENVITVSPTNGASASTSSVKSGEQYAVHCNSNARYRACASGTCTATSTDYPVFADKPIDVMMGDRAVLAFYGDGANATCRIYRVWPRTLKAAP